MTLTGKAKVRFEAWYQKTAKRTLMDFYALSDDSQWGTYQLFGDSLGYDLCVFKDEELFYWSTGIEFKEGFCASREEGWELAIGNLNDELN